MKANRRILIPVIATTAVLGVGIGVAATAVYLQDRESEVRSTCAQNAAVLSAEPEDGGTEASFELQSAAPGESWTVELRHNDKVLVSGTRVTDEDAEIDLDAFIGSDVEKNRFVVDFRGPAGERCSLTLNH